MIAFRRAASLCATAALVCVAGDAHAQLYKCRQDGRTVYQQEKCPETAQQSTVREPDAAPARPLDPKAAAEKEVRDTQGDVDKVVDAMSGFAICSETVPDFGTRWGPAFADWRTRNAAAFARFNADPEGPRKLDARMRAGRAKPTGDEAEARAARTALCARMISVIQPGRGTQ